MFTKQPKNHLTFLSLSINFHSFKNLSFYYIFLHVLFQSKHSLSLHKRKNVNSILNNNLELIYKLQQK